MTRTTDLEIPVHLDIMPSSNIPSCPIDKLPPELLDAICDLTAEPSGTRSSWQNLVAFRGICLLWFHIAELCAAAWARNVTISGQDIDLLRTVLKRAKNNPLAIDISHPSWNPITSANPDFTQIKLRLAAEHFSKTRSLRLILPKYFVTEYLSLIERDTTIPSTLGCFVVDGSGIGPITPPLDLQRLFSSNLRILCIRETFVLETLLLQLPTSLKRLDLVDLPYDANPSVNDVIYIVSMLPVLEYLSLANDCWRMTGDSTLATKIDLPNLGTIMLLGEVLVHSFFEAIDVPNAQRIYLQLSADIAFNQKVAQIFNTLKDSIGFLKQDEHFPYFGILGMERDHGSNDCLKLLASRSPISCEEELSEFPLDLNSREGLTLSIDLRSLYMQHWGAALPTFVVHFAQLLDLEKVDQFYVSNLIYFDDEDWAEIDRELPKFFYDRVENLGTTHMPWENTTTDSSGLRSVDVSSTGHTTNHASSR